MVVETSSKKFNKKNAHGIRIITKYTKKMITEKMKIRPTKKRLIDKLGKLLNEAFILGIDRAMKIQKKENEKLRRNELI